MRLTIPVCNYFKKYIQREIAKASGVSVYNPYLGWKHKRKRQWIFDEHRPWTDQAKESNFPGKYLVEMIEPVPESKEIIFKGDIVQILKGIDKGKQGVVGSIIKERNWCYIEGLNCIYKWANKSSTNPGFMSKVEKPLLTTTEVALVDPSDQQPTEVEWRYTEEGESVRISKRTGRIIPKSERALGESDDYVIKNTYKEQSCDTNEKQVTKVTYKPSLQTFEQEIMASMGIKEDRKKAPTFYY